MNNTNTIMPELGQLYKIYDYYAYIAWMGTNYFGVINFDSVEEFVCYLLLKGEQCTINQEDIHERYKFKSLYSQAKLVDLERITDSDYIQQLNNG